MKLKLTTLTLLCMVSQGVLAHPPSGEEVVAKLDQDGDQRISSDEFKLPEPRHPGKRIRRLDSDQDGAISMEELNSRMSQRLERAEAKGREIDPDRIAEHQQRMEERFSKQDLNGDGEITRDEMRMAAFTRMDDNQDGFLTADELKPRQDRRGMRRQEQRPGKRWR